jgi:hypothetical protein
LAGNPLAQVGDFPSLPTPQLLLSLRVLCPKFSYSLRAFGVYEVPEKLKGRLGILMRELKEFEIEPAKRFIGNQVIFLASAPCLVRYFLAFVHDVSDCGSTFSAIFLPSSADGVMANSSGTCEPKGIDIRPKSPVSPEFLAKGGPGRSIPVQADSGEMPEPGSELGSIGVVRQRRLE